MTELSIDSSTHLVDFHCHLDLYPDHMELIAECDRERVATLAVTTTPKAWPRNRELAASSSQVLVALGLHPQLVAEREDEISLFERLALETRYIGEVGLDAGPRFYRSFSAQERVFERVLRVCAEQGEKILSVHSIRAATKVLSHIEQYLPRERGKVVLHWFTGTSIEASRAVELGCYFSINSEMLRSPRHRAMVAQLPTDRLLTETDGPFIMRKGGPIRPVDVISTVAELAVNNRTSEQDMRQVILSNFTSLIAG